MKNIYEKQIHHQVEIRFVLSSKNGVDRMFPEIDDENRLSLEKENSPEKMSEEN
jgi:hypothetical protein